MANIEKSTIQIPTAAAVLLAFITIGGGIVGNYWATRSAVELELNQLRNDLRYEVAQLRNEDERLKGLVSRNREDISHLQAAIKPEEPIIKSE